MIGILFCTLIMMPLDMWGTVQYILAALIIVFITGLRDDIEEISPIFKISGQLIAIAILVTKGGVRLESLYGLFGQAWSFPYAVSVVLSAFTLLVIINSFNLIDGINGLAGTIGTIICCTFGVWFFLVGEIPFGILSMVTAGSLLAFLRFNTKPAKTFMGDSGALVVGLVLGVLAIKFIDYASTMEVPVEYAFSSPVAVCMGILVIPLFDTIRVFVTRIVRGGSPFQPDRRHIHHLLIDSGFEHLEATTLLGLANLLIISLMFFLDGLLVAHGMIGLTLGIALLLTFILHRNVQLIKARQQQQLSFDQKA